MVVTMQTQMLEPRKFEKLFSTPLLRFAVPDSQGLNAALLDLGAEMQKKSKGVAKSNRGGWHSEGNLFDHPADCVQQLRDLANEGVREATTRIGSKADVDDLRLKIFAWMNVNPAGGFNAPHTHPGAHWSGVYYVSQPEVAEGNAGMIEFLDPRSDLPNWRILKAPPFRLKKKLRPAAGEMVFFPSYLLHWVYPNDSDEDRVTIAFNATFSKPRKS